MTWARITLRVPLNPRFPWKPAQGTLVDGCEELMQAAVDGVRWHDACDPGRRMTTAVVLETDAPPPRRSVWQWIADQCKER